MVSVRGPRGTTRWNARRRRSRARIPFVVAAAGVLAGAVFAAAALVVAACGPDAEQGSTLPRNALQRDFQNVVREDLSSVVEIKTATSTGSGVVFDAKGDIVTN